MLFSPSERHGWPSFFPFFSFFFCLKNSFFIGRKENRSTTTSSFGRDRDESLTRYPWRRSTPRGHAPRRLFSFPSRVFVVGKRKRFNLKKTLGMFIDHGGHPQTTFIGHQLVRRAMRSGGRDPEIGNHYPRHVTRRGGRDLPMGQQERNTD